MSNPSDVPLQNHAQSPPDQSLRSISPSYLSGDHTHRDLKYLGRLLESSLATIAIIQFSGNTLADIFTPRANDSFKALCALAPSDGPTSSTKSQVGDIPTRSDFSNTPTDSNKPDSPPLPYSSLAVSRTFRTHISISVGYEVLFSWTGFVAVSCLVFYVTNLPQFCGIGERRV